MDGNVAGIWFCGLAGSGKTHASKLVCANKKLGFLVDGDNVRKHVSQDLLYDLPSRKIQIGRILGISKLAIDNGFFPIASSVYMNNEMIDQCQAVRIQVVLIKRADAQIRSVRELYKNTNDVVGKDIQMPELNSMVLENSGDVAFHDAVLNLLEDSSC